MSGVFLHFGGTCLARTDALPAVQGANAIVACVPSEVLQSGHRLAQTVYSAGKSYVF